LTLAYRTLPEPSWYPNTTAIGICAVKLWMYYPTIGILFMLLSTSFCIILLPISICRTFLGDKISASVCWMQMSAPSYALYALTIMGQPNTSNGDYPEGKSLFQQIHRIIYLPFMHFFFILGVMAVLSSVYGVYRRWNYFRNQPFSPAYAAFTCPQLTHANAIQSYRSALNAFSALEATHPYRIFITYYWILFLFLGTILSLYVSTRYLSNLRYWIWHEEEEEPPAPNETSMIHLLTIGDDFISSYISPAILQANETGILYKTDGTVYRRTKRISALGFIPTLTSSEMMLEHQFLLDYFAKHPRKESHIGVPGVDFHDGFDDHGQCWKEQRRNKRGDTYQC